MERNKKSKQANLSQLNQIEIEEAIQIAKEVAKEKFSDSLSVVLKSVIDNPELSCSLKLKATDTSKVYIEKWTKKYLKGFENRASVRKTNPIGTKEDPLLNEIIKARLPENSKDVKTINKYHRLAMSAENIAGSLLEEFLSVELLKYGWYCCWGETMRSVDFCHINGQLLQIKNSDNSENSSSKSVRTNTEIKHWFRRMAKTGKTNWEALNKLIASDNDLTEEGFIEFAKNIVTSNPDSMYVEH